MGRADGSHENASHFHATNDARNLEASALVYAMYYIYVYIGGRKAGRKDSLASNSEPQSRMKFGKARSGRRRFLWDQNIRIIFHRFDRFLFLSNSLYFLRIKRFVANISTSCPVEKEIFEYPPESWTNLSDG